MQHETDPIAAYNERLKARATYINAFSIGLIGFAVLRPLTDLEPTLSPSMAGWFIAALALHIVAHDLLGQMRRGVEP